ncbi:MAG: NAD(P)H-dependent oxidoreductase [Holophagales bacterium]|jgi:flavodoxin|nr:NAD(P)H-dependent oxidoreductase [Holophagales bacterium]
MAAPIFLDGDTHFEEASIIGMAVLQLPRWIMWEGKQMGKKLVAYFSTSGLTRSVAESLAQTANADLYEIKPKVPYTKADLDWQNKQSRSSIEMGDKSSRPELADKDANIAAYDVVFIGFPIWWYVAPTIVNTFLESYDFAGKTIILFATSGSSGMGQTVANLKDSVNPSATIIEGKVLNGQQTKESLADWVNSLGL